MGSHILRLIGRHSCQDGQGSNEGGFSEEQLQMYKDCFKLMDINKDGQLDKNDLRRAFDNVGVLMSESELDGLLGEISGPCTYDNMVKMFQEKMAGEGNDPDDLIVQAFKAYDNEGKIDSKMFEHALKTWGDKMTKAEIDDIFGEFEIDEDYMIKTKDVIGLFVSVKEEVKKEPTPPPVEEAPPAEEDEGDAKKKKKKKKKAANYEDSTFHRKEKDNMKQLTTISASSKQYCRLVFGFDGHRFHYKFAIYQ